ncbi:MAG TPA: hypothetical protein VFQ39_00825, partial [Longimicrobium sp.]|nr:hypothetical protein [Longimicrobium sp.]
LKLVRALGYDMNSVEWAVRDGVPYAIDFMNPAPDMDVYSLTPHYFDWVVKAMADMAIRLAKNPRPQGHDLRWSGFFTHSRESGEATSTAYVHEPSADEPGDAAVLDVAADTLARDGSQGGGAVGSGNSTPGGEGEGDGEGEGRNPGLLSGGRAPGEGGGQGQNAGGAPVSPPAGEPA